MPDTLTKTPTLFQQPPEPTLAITCREKRPARRLKTQAVKDQKRQWESWRNQQARKELKRWMRTEIPAHIGSADAHQGHHRKKWRRRSSTSFRLHAIRGTEWEERFKEKRDEVRERWGLWPTAQILAVC